MIGTIIGVGLLLWILKDLKEILPPLLGLLLVLAGVGFLMEFKVGEGVASLAFGLLIFSSIKK